MPILVPVAPPPFKPRPVSHQTPCQAVAAAAEKLLPSEARTECLEVKAGSKVPIVSLDADKITDAVAASLATSLLGHVLFLKSQVPLPVQQLTRIQSSKSTTRATKQRTDLLWSFDTLASHLNTTFTALSSALARSRTSGQVHSNVQSSPAKDRARAYLAILVGPSMGSAKAKVMFAVDGLETKVWGLREDVHRVTQEEEKDETGDEGGDDFEEDSSGSDGFKEDDENGENSSDVDTDDDEYNEASEDSPPPSRSPSPAPHSHADQNRALQAADRLLSRTLAAADADGYGMSADMAPTQTHILLRAPRRFIHPAWIPRQNMSASLDSTLREFLEESGLSKIGDGDVSIKKRKAKKGSEVEGIWITCRDGLKDVEGDDQLIPVAVQHTEWDEMIWWSWDGKIAGFSEW